MISVLEKAEQVIAEAEVKLAWAEKEEKRTWKFLTSLIDADLHPSAVLLDECHKTARLAAALQANLGILKTLAEDLRADNESNKTT